MDNRLKVLFLIWALVNMLFRAMALLSVLSTPSFRPTDLVVAMLGPQFLGALLAYAGGYYFLVAAMTGDRWGKLLSALFLMSHCVIAISSIMMGPIGLTATKRSMWVWSNVFMPVLIGGMAVVAIPKTGGAVDDRRDPA
ncbi:hypothetical protein N9971_00400 [bacterium]|nr:hypothetical protein [bacterium]